MKHNKRILISGASIAGPTLAFWLNRYGFEPTIVERAPDLRKGGQGVDVRGLSIDVVKRMGLWPQLQAAAIDTYGVIFMDEGGRSKAKLQLKQIRENIKSEEVEIHRGDLAQILYEATKNDVPYLFGTTIEALHQTKEGVEVQFKNGTTELYHLVIGADGIHSNVRKLAFGPESDYIQFKNHYFAFCKTRAQENKKGWVSIMNTPGKLAGYHSSTTQKFTGAYFMFYQKKPLIYDYNNSVAQKKLLIENFAGYNSWIDQLLEGVNDDPNFYFDTLCQVKMPSWSNGRISLIGDAAYCASPASGAGATLALLGAYRLAGELATAGGDYQPGFKQYEAGFRKMVEHVQKQIWVELLVPQTRFGIWARNTFLNLPILSTLAVLENRFNLNKNQQLPWYE
jgi:2-polyprenyl-6-methoxyphenol hydroxylase-like FAD-dependent oxidoreductase